MIKDLLERFAFNLAICFVFAVLSLAVTAQPGNCVAHKIISEGGPYVCKSRKIQKFSTTIKLADKYRTAPLYMTFFNGYGGKPGYSWARVFLVQGSGKRGLSHILLDEAAFRTHRAKTVEVTGSIPVVSTGGARIVVEAQGNPGAIFAWELTTAKSEISLLSATSITPGQKFLLHGTGFSSNANEIQVYVGNKRAQILGALPKMITAKAPKKIKGKNVSVRVVSGGKSTNTLSIALAHVPPVLASISPKGGPVGGILSIRGANFSRVPDQNIVKIGPYTAPVIRVQDDGTLLCRIPEWFGFTTLPVRVITNGMPSENTLQFWCTSHYYGGNPNAATYHYD